ncbi:M16 family metallopeptidase [Shewanella cyperi]|uniref:M16 family metallopeptidase n=1 Tax=Shewanella cyperi TaxID=2814292 RepID=UPI001A945450|nr:pitrilysin family protein [Shewanella cyperi]QSX40800.1 insulinase family protein [Shewanella cyperi]
MKILRKNRIASALLLALGGMGSFTALAADKVTEVEGITEYRLDNGLKVLLFPDATKETVTVNVTYHVGSKHENYGETGMAHLLEHMVFKGSPNHKDIPSELSSHGARPNGTTWTDRTNYFETFAATEENIDWALSMESDRMVNSFIAKKDLDTEMTVVRNEFEKGENSPMRITLQRMMSTAFEWHNYGKSTIGARSDLENVSIERLQAFYKKYYQPDNATLIVAGKFDSKVMLGKIESKFGAIPKPQRALEPLYTQEPAQDGERQVTVRRVGDVQLLGSMYHVPPGAHEDYAAIDLLNEILGATPNGRLHKAMVENKLASSVYGMGFQWQEPGLAIFIAELDKAANIDKSQKVFLDTLESIQSQPITEKELETAKRTLLKNLTLAFNSSERVALELSEWLGMGDWRLLFLNRDRLEKVTLADVQRVAEYYLAQNNRTLGRFIPSEKPERIEIPAVADVTAMVKDYKGRELVAQGEAFDPSQDSIDSRTQTLVLKSGTQVALLPKKTRGETVVLRMNAQFGDLSSLKGKNTVGEAVGEMLLRGSSKYSREQIKEELDKLQANLQIGSGNGSLFLTLETTKDKLTSVLAIVTDVLRNPTFPEKEFEQYRAEAKVAIEQNLQDPQALAFNAFSRHQSPYEKDDPRHVGSFEEQLAELDALNLKQLKQYHKEFYGAKQMQIAVIGDFDTQTTLNSLESLTNNWNGKRDYQRIDSPYQKLDANPISFNTPDKENATFVASLQLPAGDTSVDAPALTLGNYILGGGFLSSRLATRLRQQDGLSYTAGSFLQFESEDQRAILGAYAICAPQNLNKVETGFKEEIARLLKDGFTADEVAAAKSGLLQGRKVSRAQDKELVRTLSKNLKLERSMDFDKDFEAQIQALTAEDLTKVFRNYIKVEDFALIKAGDISKVE